MYISVNTHKTNFVLILLYVRPGTLYLGSTLESSGFLKSKRTLPLCLLEDKNLNALDTSKDENMV